MLRAGDRVQLRPPSEIIRTLDERGCLDGMPFMPEMLAYFGKTYTVTAQVGRACDTVNYSGVRRLKDTVILDDLRCDGAGHAGCQAQCRVYWKEAWLRPVSRVSTEAGGADAPTTLDPTAFTELERLAIRSVDAAESSPRERVYRCQATDLLGASEPVGWWNFRSIVGELTSGNVSVGRFVRVSTRIVLEEVARRLGLLTNSPFRKHEMGSRSSALTDVTFTPGQLVKIRSRSEIGKTLAQDGKHRGLWFDREMVPHCGRTARVRSKVERFIDEGSGRLVELGSECYILDGIVCDSARSEGRWFCPRAIYPWWRGVWLQPLDSPDLEAAQIRTAVD